MNDNDNWNEEDEDMYAVLTIKKIMPDDDSRALSMLAIAYAERIVESGLPDEAGFEGLKASLALRSQAHCGLTLSGYQGCNGG